MALYFAKVKVGVNQNLYDAIVVHYSTIPKLNIPTLLPPIPRMVSWIKLDSADTGILGSINSSPYTATTFLLPIEISGGDMRNTIDLSGIVFDNVAQVLVNTAFSII